MPRLALAVLTLVLAAAAPASAQLPGGLSSGNVEHVTNFAAHADTAGGKLLGGHYYVTTERDLSIYDVAQPEAPRLVGSALFDSPGTPVFTEEDPDTNGRILVTSNTDFFVFDVSDKTAPRVVGRIPGLDQHTMSCVLDCTWVYGSEGAIVDLRDPAQPKLLETGWREQAQPAVTSTHDVTEVSPGLLVTSTEPLLVLDARENPAAPKVVGSATTPGFAHANLWPRGGADDLLLVGGEETGPGCSEAAGASFMTFDARSFGQSRTFALLDEFKLGTGMIADGRSPETTFCVHWFSPHPTWANGGLVAIAWYEHGTRFLQVARDGQISEIGWFLPYGPGQASDVDWITDRVVYVADYLRGLDVLKFTGDIPPSFPAPPAPGAPMPAASPSAGASFDDLVRLPSARRCVRARSFRVAIRSHRADPVRSAVLRVGGRRVASARSAKALRRGLRAKRLPAGRFAVQVQVRTRSGFATAGGRTYRRCA